MSHTQSTINTKFVEAGMGRNALVNDLATRAVYDKMASEMQLRARRPKINFSKAVNQEQTLLAMNAYPEFEITFVGNQNAVHSLAGGLRALELEYMMTLVPYGHVTYDIGGNFASHLFKGRDYVHCCAPNLDIRDVARHTAQQDSIMNYSAKLESQQRVIPKFQLEAFNKYANNPRSVVCNNTFQTCEFEPSAERVYAVALHSIYDIPVDEFGAALLRKNVHKCFAAFHFSENLLLEVDSCNLEEIGASFVRNNDNLSFFFHGESTLNYSHSYRNVIKYVCKTFFPASNRYVYHKEFMVTRVNTWFCSFTKVDTYVLFRGVYRTDVDSEQFYQSMDEAWEYKKSLAMLNSERTILKDSSAVNYWFPKVKDMVIIPLFHGSLASGKTKRTEVMVDRDFVYTVLNHIRTYQAKALTYQNVLSFVESIRARVILNGTTARSNWDVDKGNLQALAMTFFLQTKLAAAQDELVTAKFRTFDQSVKELLWQRVSDFFGDVFPSVKDKLTAHGLIKISEKELEIKVPDLYVSFVDRLVSEYKASEELADLDLTKPLEKAEKFYKALSELSILKDSSEFDVEEFKTFCNEKDVDPEVVAKVLVAVAEGQLTLPYEKPTPASVSDALAPKIHEDEEEILLVGNTDEFPRLKEIDSVTLPLAGISGTKRGFSPASSFHLLPVEDFRKNMLSVVYTGSLKVQQMKNYVDYLSASVSATVSNLSRLLNDTIGMDNDVREKAGVFDVRSGKWLITPTGKLHAWGVVEFLDRKKRIVLLDWTCDSVPTCQPDWVRLAVSTDTLIYSDLAKLQNLRGSLRDGEPTEPKAKIILVDGVPGCGKTKEILERCDFTKDLILVPGKEASKMIIKRANAGGKNRANQDNVRTVDSFLIHMKGTQVKRLFIDEGLMLHTGCVNFLALFSHCEEVLVYGDTHQIPFINRVANFPYPSHFARLQYDSVEKRRVTLRCPADVTHHLNSQYDGKVMCTSSILRSVECEVVRGKAVLNPKTKPLSGKIITFTQSDKLELQNKGYGEVDVLDVNTVHEIQGETYEHVSLVRLTPTPLEIVSHGSPHVLVALTRHTQSLKYYTVVWDPVVKVISDLGKLSNFILDMYKVEKPVQ
nr:replication-associated protein [Streptocarpus flower break virus]WJP00476.1 replication-associated protein [Streptocarpus flower break virus]